MAPVGALLGKRFWFPVWDFCFLVIGLGDDLSCIAVFKLTTFDGFQIIMQKHDTLGVIHRHSIVLFWRFEKRFSVD